jgi:signal peptidase I
MTEVKNFLSFFWDVFKIVVLAAIIVLPIRYFLFQPFLVNGSSMEPNLSDGDYLIVDEISYNFRQPQRGEIIIFDYSSETRFIKRIIGLPGEKLNFRENQIEIVATSGEEIILDEASYLSSPTNNADFSITLGDKQYFVMGDNRSFSFDSRNWGPISEERIVGRAWLRLWPLTEREIFSIPAYSL